MSEQMSARRLRAEPEREPVSGWAVGFAVFGGVTMALIGTFQAIQGFAALLKDEFFVVTKNYVYDIDVTVWGWIHLILGIVVTVVGFMVLTGALWARVLGIGLVAVNMISQFLFMPYYPVWSIIMIALDALVIWALCVYDRSAAEEAGA
ncbi:hypothetical protein ACGFNU_44720 [Spirillospora sp. NPDC048911]|uniref:DUF7144 family membrane protein n=1 Tax=Spirillospora sp. NPDC048911 TaxID=3364527 RepID=UPI0037245778